MSLNLGRDFSVRWQAAPELFRQEIFFELQGLTDLLASADEFESWKQAHEAQRILLITRLAAEKPADPPGAPVADARASSPHSVLSEATPAATTLPLSIPQHYRDYIDARLNTLREELELWLLDQLTAPAAPSSFHRVD